MSPASGEDQPYACAASSKPDSTSVEMDGNLSSRRKGLPLNSLGGSWPPRRASRSSASTVANTPTSSIPPSPGCSRPSSPREQQAPRDEVLDAFAWGEDDVFPELQLSLQPSGLLPPHQKVAATTPRTPRSAVNRQAELKTVETYAAHMRAGRSMHGFERCTRSTPREVWARQKAN